jgi:Family of unknown function (DUF6084)
MAVLELSFDVLEARAEPYAAVPTLAFRLRVGAAPDVAIHAIGLRCQIRIEPQRRRYSPAEESRLLELFGETPQWGESLRPFLWTNVSATITGFTGVTEADLPVPCTYDFEVAAAKYLHGLGDGEIPLNLLFSGTVFSRGGAGFTAEPVPWHAEAGYRLPVVVWRDRMDHYFPNSGWLRLHRDTLPPALQGGPGRPHLGAGHRAAAEGSRRGGRMTASPDLDARWAPARRLADAVLYEGYVLYPYRASAAKNQLRWQFGVLAPRPFSEADGSEPWSMQTECIAEVKPSSVLAVRVRGLQVQSRMIERAPIQRARCGDRRRGSKSKGSCGRPGTRRSSGRSTSPVSASTGRGRPRPGS